MTKMQTFSSPAIKETFMAVKFPQTDDKIFYPSNQGNSQEHFFNR